MILWRIDMNVFVYFVLSLPAFPCSPVQAASTSDGAKPPPAHRTSSPSSLCSLLSPPFFFVSSTFHCPLHTWTTKKKTLCFYSPHRDVSTTHVSRTEERIHRPLRSPARCSVMSAYGFSTVNNVLPLGVHRAYVPRAARPHLCWAASTTTSPSPSAALGDHCRLKGDGTAARETRAAQEERERDESASNGAYRASQPTDVSLCALLSTDGATGTQLALYHDPAAPDVAVCSSTIPSQRRVVALWSPPLTKEGKGGLDCLLGGDLPLYVSDDVGNIFHYSWNEEGEHGVREPVTKRHRGERGGHDPADASAWTRVAAAQSSMLSCVGASSSSSDALEGLFAVSRGAPGWAGLTALETGAADASHTLHLVSARELYHDMRLIDPAAQTIVRVYSTTHPPTGLLATSAQAAPHCVLVTEGCLATLFDVRCPSAVLSLGEVYAAQAEWTAAREEAAAEKAQADAQQEHGDKAKHDSAEGGKSALAAAAATASPKVPLVPGRLTSTVGQVRDVCATANPFEVACAVDRALCVYDVRKFNRLFTSSSVLKYVIRSVTPVAGGRGVVCAGIDSEVRLVPLYDKAATGAVQTTLSLAAPALAKKKPQPQRNDNSRKPGDSATSAPAVFDVETMGPGGTFRTRLNTSVSCTSVWQGGWVSSQNMNGVAAVGVSVDGEVFLAQ